MPWVYTSNRSRRRTRRSSRRGRRSYNTSYASNYNGYGNGYDNPYPPRRRRRSQRADDWDGALYDRDGNDVRLVIQTPGDLLPPRRPANERMDDGSVSRSFRARF